MQKLTVRLLLLATMLIIVSAAVLSFLSLRHFERELAPEMSKKSRVIGESINNLMNKALSYGIDFSELRGVDEYLDSVRKDNPDILYVIVTDASGKPVYASGLDRARMPDYLVKLLAQPTDKVTSTVTPKYLDTALPLSHNGKRIGSMHLGQDALIVEQKLQEILYDILTVLVVAALIAFELMRFVVIFSVSTPGLLIHDAAQRASKGQFAYTLPRDIFGGIGRLNTHVNALMDQLNDRYAQLQQRMQALEQKLGREVAQQRMSLFMSALNSKFRFRETEERRNLSAAVVDYVRWPFFLLIFSESLSLSFFPLFVDQLYSQDLGLSKQVVIGLPISLFMLVWALSMPWAGMWSDRIGYRKAFMVGAGVTTAGLILTSLTVTLWDLLLWRSVTAIGYGLVFITAQSYIANNTPADQRTKGMAVFLASFFAGSLSGAAIGGILSDRIGYNTTFLVSGLLSLLAAFFVQKFLHDRSTDGTLTSFANAAKKKLTAHDFRLLLRNKHFVTVTFLAAIPSKIALTGFLYYSAPLYLKYLGNSQSVTGRVMMAYGLAIILFSPMVARIADSLGHHRIFVSVGGFAAGIAMLLIHYNDSTLGVVLSITLLGVAHAVGVSTQQTLISDSCQDVIKEVGVGTSTGIFRLIERLGNVLGPIVAGALIAVYGFKGAFYGIGFMTLCTISLFTVLLLIFDFQKKRQTPVVA